MKTLIAKIKYHARTLFNHPDCDRVYRYGICGGKVGGLEGEEGMISKILFPVRTVFNWLLDSYRRVCDIRPDDSPVMEYIIWVSLISSLAGFMYFIWRVTPWESLIG